MPIFLRHSSHEHGDRRRYGKAIRGHCSRGSLPDGLGKVGWVRDSPWVQVTPLNHRLSIGLKRAFVTKHAHVPTVQVQIRSCSSNGGGGGRAERRWPPARTHPAGRG